MHALKFWNITSLFIYSKRAFINAREEDKTTGRAKKMTGRASSSSFKRPRSRSFLTGASLFLLSLSFRAKSAVGGSTTENEEDGVVQWGEFTAEKSMTIYGAYDAKKTIKFEFKPESGHDVYRVADLTAFNACDLTDATKMDEVCFHYVLSFFLFPYHLIHTQGVLPLSKVCLASLFDRTLRRADIFP